MRIRTAAIAGASAVAVALSGATAVAQEGNSSFSGSSTIFNESTTAGGYEGQEGQSKSTLSSQIGAGLEKELPANGVSIFGSSKDGSEELADGDISSQPAWAQTFYGLGIAAAVVTVIGLAVGPVLNFIKYGPQTQLFR